MVGGFGRESCVTQGVSTRFAATRIDLRHISCASRRRSLFCSNTLEYNYPPTPRSSGCAARAPDGRSRRVLAWMLSLSLSLPLSTVTVTAVTVTVRYSSGRKVRWETVPGRNLARSVRDENFLTLIFTRASSGARSRRVKTDHSLEHQHSDPHVSMTLRHRTPTLLFV